VTAFKDHFSDRAAEYAVYRPAYPPALIAHVAQLAPAHDLAWDAGTGNGQAAVMLAEHFRRVIATDASEEQLARAKPHPRVEYRVARESSSGLASASVDLVTIAQALHWFDHARFWPEVHRVLVPRGICAAWMYDKMHIDPEADAVIHRVHAERIEEYWPPERKHVDAKYADIPFPFEELPQEEWSMSARLTREQFLGYVGTWSAVMRARKETGGAPVAAMRNALAPVWPEDPEDVRNVVWPITLRVGRNGP